MRSEADLHSYQVTGTRFLLDNPRSALWVDLGLGKTAMSLTMLNEVMRDLDSGQALIIAPIRVAKQTWPTEIAEWEHTNWLTHTLIRAEDGDDDVRSVFDQHRIRFLESAKAMGVPAAERGKAAGLFAAPFRERYKQEKRRRLANSKTSLHIVGLPQIEWLVQHHGKHWPYKIVIVDESSAFKDFTTKRWKALNAVNKYIERFHLLTASPAAESWLSLWAQVRLLDRGERLGRSITHYRDDYFNHDPYTYSYTLKRGAEDRITEKVSDICMVMKAEDHLSLEKPNYLTRYIELSDAAIAMYDNFVRDFILTLPSAEIEAMNGGVLINKLLQFTGGAVLDEDKNLHEVHDDKIEELRELIDEVGDTPIMVAYWYKSSLTRLKRAFPQGVVMDKAGKCVAEWNADKIPLLFIQAASAAHGLNMQYGSSQDIVYFDLPWGYETYSQLIGRLARQGQKKVVRVWHLVVRRKPSDKPLSRKQAEDAMTADEIVMQALADKGAGQDRLFRLIRDIRARAKVVKPVNDSEDDL